MVKFKEIYDAFDFVSFGDSFSNEVYFCKVTEKFYYYSEFGDDLEALPDDIEDERYIGIPHKNDLDLGRELVFKFADNFCPDKSGQVKQFFSHRGGYSKYKLLLEEHNLLEKWFEFENESQISALKDWCIVNALDVDFS